MNISFSKIVNAILLILFAILAVNSAIIHFHLSENMGNVISLHKKVGWSFLFFLLIHTLMNFRYYKNIFR